MAQGGVSSLTITVVGSVLTGSNSYPVTKGLNFYGNFLPISGDITTNGFPVIDKFLPESMESSWAIIQPSCHWLGNG